MASILPTTRPPPKLSLASGSATNPNSKILAPVNKAGDRSPPTLSNTLAQGPITCGPAFVPTPQNVGLRSKIQKQEEILNRKIPPAHWRAAPDTDVRSRIRRTLFNILCFTSFGHAGLEPIWAAIKLEEEGDDTVWVDGINQTCDRLNNMLLVASLLLATSAAFITTTPPRTSLINYTQTGSYICFLGAFGLLLGGIVVASVAVMVTGKARPYWSEQVLYSDRVHVYCTLIALSYPFFSIGMAALLLAFGALSAVWSSATLALKIGALVPLLLPVGVGLLFGCSSATASATWKSRLRKDGGVTSLI